MSNETEYDRNETIETLLAVWPEFDPKGVSKADLLWLTEVAALLGDDASKTMSATLLRYRAKYSPTVAYSGRKSLHNADPIALFLEGMEPDDVMAAAERILGLEPGFLSEKYASLNPGARRMNSGNRIRAALKRGDISETDLAH